MSNTSTSARRPGVTWDRSEAARGAVCCLPALALMMAGAPTAGAFAALGALPVAMLGVPPVRRARIRLIGVAIAFAVGYCLGALVASAPIVAVLATALVAAGSIILIARRPALKGVAALAVPGFVLGMNVTPGAGVALAVLFLGGGAWAVLVTWSWPVSPQLSPPIPSPAPSVAATSPPAQHALPPAVVVYAVLYSTAITTGLIVGFMFDFDHIGWAAGAAALIMRPEPELSLRRSVERVVATYIGVVLAAVFDTHGLGRIGFAAIVIVAVAAAVGTRTSRWYVSSGFTGIVTLLVAGTNGTGPFDVALSERVIETTIGAALAVGLGTFVPRLLTHRHRSPAGET